MWYIWRYIKLRQHSWRRLWKQLEFAASTLYVQFNLYLPVWCFGSRVNYFKHKEKHVHCKYFWCLSLENSLSWKWVVEKIVHILHIWYLTWKNICCTFHNSDQPLSTHNNNSSHIIKNIPREKTPISHTYFGTQLLYFWREKWTKYDYVQKKTSKNSILFGNLNELSVQRIGTS